MLKLIDEDGDSFAKKAEMYYQKRPELISHVEHFYRMYRSLAERYDHLTGELRKSIPSDLQSQGSGVSDIGSELPSACPSPDNKLSRRKSGPRAAGFDVFLGSAGSTSDVYQKEGEETSSSSDSDVESDASSVNNYTVPLGNGSSSVQGLNRKIMDLEIELREVKEKLRIQQGDCVDLPNNDNTGDLLARIAGYEHDLRMANEKIKLSEGETSRLRIELQKYKSVETCEFESSSSGEHSNNGKLRISEKETASMKQERDQCSERIQHLKSQLELAQKDVVTWKSKANAEKREVSKLQERITRLKTSLSDRDHEVRDLKTAVSDAEEKIFPEKAQIKAEISKLLEEQTYLKEHLREWESRGRSLEDDIRMIANEKRDTEQRLQGEMNQLKVEIAGRSDCIRKLHENLDALKAEREELDAKVDSLETEVRCRDEQITEMKKHVHQLHMEHAELVGSAEGARKQVQELRSKSEEMEEEIERQRVIIEEGAEEKREAIRQLCFSLDHYRSSYVMLRRQAFGNNKRGSFPVLAS